MKPADGIRDPQLAADTKTAGVAVDALVVAVPVDGTPVPSGATDVKTAVAEARVAGEDTAFAVPAGLVPATVALPDGLDVAKVGRWMRQLEERLTTTPAAERTTALLELLEPLEALVLQERAVGQAVGRAGFALTLLWREKVHLDATIGGREFKGSGDFLAWLAELAQVQDGPREWLLAARAAEAFLLLYYRRGAGRPPVSATPTKGDEGEKRPETSLDTFPLGDADALPRWLAEHHRVPEGADARPVVRRRHEWQREVTRLMRVAQRTLKSEPTVEQARTIRVEMAAVAEAEARRLETLTRPLSVTPAAAGAALYLGAVRLEKAVPGLFVGNLDQLAPKAREQLAADADRARFEPSISREQGVVVAIRFPLSPARSRRHAEERERVAWLERWTPREEPLS